MVAHYLSRFKLLYLRIFKEFFTKCLNLGILGPEVYFKVALEVNRIVIFGTELSRVNSVKIFKRNLKMGYKE